jgi:hypothetical protein
MAAIIAVMAVMAFPGFSIGDPTTSHGGSPSDVFMSTDPGVCPLDPVQTEPVSLGPTEVDVGEESHLLVYFSSTWSGFEEDSELVLRLQILDGNGFFESSPDLDFRGAPGHHGATVMYSFADVDTGAYTVQMSARLDSTPAGGTEAGELSAELNDCALTVFVMPPLA